MNKTKLEEEKKKRLRDENCQKIYNQRENSIISGYNTRWSILTWHQIERSTQTVENENKKRKIKSLRNDWQSQLDERQFSDRERNFVKREIHEKTL